jgi:replicative DNA helicase
MIGLRNTSDELEKTLVELETDRKPDGNISWDKIQYLSFSDGLPMNFALKSYFESFEPEKGGISLGYESLDRVIRGLRQGELLTIMASTSVGKTWLALNILRHISIKNNCNIGYISLDDPVETIVERMLQLTLAKSREEINRMRLNKEYDELAKLAKEYLGVKLFAGLNKIPAIEAAVKRNQLQVVFIDYLGLINVDSSNQYERITRAMSGLKEIAVKKKILVIVLHQLSRRSEGGTIPVTMDMARDSGAVEEMSSFVIGAHRPEFKDERKGEECKKYENIIFLKLLKNKRGLSHMIACNFNKKTGEITEYEEYVMDKKSKDVADLPEEL